jgi:putative ATP-binding cassette transporter
VLSLAKLNHLKAHLDRFDNWSLRLSPGEQQRLAFARALLQKPDFLFLDEATSALDEQTEREMYQLMIDQLPGAAMVSIAHRSTVAAFHDRRLRYVGATDSATDDARFEEGEGAGVSYRVVQEA